jgi:hypothetical protein
MTGDNVIFLYTNYTLSTLYVTYLIFWILPAYQLTSFISIYNPAKEFLAVGLDMWRGDFSRWISRVLSSRKTTGGKG